MAREKDDRRIVSDVQLPDQWLQGPTDTSSRARGFTTFSPGDEDGLEEAMTQEQQEYLLAQGAIEGTWAAKGTLPEGVKNEGPPKRLATARKASDVRMQLEAARKAEEEGRARALKEEPDGGGPRQTESDAEREQREGEEQQRQEAARQQPAQPQQQQTQSQPPPPDAERRERAQQQAQQRQQADAERQRQRQQAEAERQRQATEAAETEMQRRKK